MTKPLIDKLARRFELKLAQENVHYPTQEELKDKLVSFKVDDAVERFKPEAMEFLGLKNPNDMQVKCEYLPQSKRARCTISFSPAIKAQVNQRIADNKKLYPSFSFSNYAKSYLERLSLVPVDVMIY